MNSIEEKIRATGKETAAATAALAAIEGSPLYLWTRVHLSDHRDILEICEIPAEIGSRIKKLSRQPAEARLAIAKIEKETAALEQSWQQGSITPEQAVAAAESLLKQAGDVNAAIKTLGQSLDGLREFDSRIKSCLTVNSLITIARSRLSGRERETFDHGCRIFRAITDVAAEQEDIANLSRCYDEVSALIDRMSAKTPPPLPGLAARVFDHFMTRMIDSSRDLQENIRAILALAKDEMAPIRAIREQSERLGDLNIKEVLDFADSGAETLGRAISTLADRNDIHDLVPAVTMLTTQLAFFVDCLDEDLFNQLSDRAEDPSRFAASMTESFFRGVVGLWRLVRLVAVRVTGDGRVPTPPEITAILEKLINECPAFHGRRPENVEALRRVIEDAIGDCKKPFPHDDLMRLCKTTILQYGDSSETSFAAIPLPEEIPVVPGVKKPKAELGGLVEFFEKGVMALGKHLPVDK